MSRTKIAVKVENQVFNSIKDACAYLKLNTPAGLAHAIKRGNSTYKGLAIERVNPIVPDKVKKMKKNNRLECPVVCENLNLHFRNIRQAAAYAKVDGWTMSKKMSTAGQFKDKDGNIYKRLKPMKSKNVYENTGDTIKTTRAFAHRTVKKDLEEVKPAQVIQELPTQPIVDKVQLAKDVLKEKVIASIKVDDYVLAKNLIDVIQTL
jgi:hypothetical protein